MAHQTNRRSHQLITWRNRYSSWASIREPPGISLKALVLGSAEKINVRATPRGTHATEMVAEGGADLAVMPVSEILHAAGVDFAGDLPPKIQFVQVFSAVVVAGSEEIEGSD